jgi:hypothetical protein
MSLEFFQSCIQVQIDQQREDYTRHGWALKERPAGVHTIGDFIGAVMVIDTPENARQFYEGYLTYLENQPDRTMPPEAVARANIGWCFGEGLAQEKIEMWIHVCHAAHPMFGTTKPSTELPLLEG